MLSCDERIADLNDSIKWDVIRDRAFAIEGKKLEAVVCIEHTPTRTLCRSTIDAILKVGRLTVSSVPLYDAAIHSPLFLYILCAVIRRFDSLGLVECDDDLKDFVDQCGGGVLERPEPWLANIVDDEIAPLVLWNIPMERPAAIDCSDVWLSETVAPTKPMASIGLPVSTDIPMLLDRCAHSHTDNVRPLTGCRKSMRPSVVARSTVSTRLF
jgi:hypothetical protein